MFSFITTITKNRKRVIVLVTIAAIASGLGIASSLILGPDNPVEQASESVVNYTVKEATGIPANIDFSPEK